MKDYIVDRVKGNAVMRVVRMRDSKEVIGGIIPVFTRGFLANCADVKGKMMFGKLDDAAKYILRRQREYQRSLLVQPKENV